VRGSPHRVLLLSVSLSRIICSVFQLDGKLCIPLPNQFLCSISSRNPEALLAVPSFVCSPRRSAIKADRLPTRARIATTIVDSPCHPATPREGRQGDQLEADQLLPK
jgi:hypothetical protein